jgi:hypothetical protein
MNTLQLSGLKGTEPIGFLAAVGLLRVLAKRRTFGAVKLGWSDDSVWSAVLFTEKTCDEEQLIGDLLVHMRGRAAFPVFAGVKPDGKPLDDAAWGDVKVAQDRFAMMLGAVQSEARPSDRETADFYSALGSELITLGNKDVVKPSALHMTSGNQAFLESVRELARSLDTSAPPHPKSAVPPADAFREAVFARNGDGQQGWRAADEFSAMGFDPAREAVYALTATAPTSTGPRSTRAAVWLAIEAVPLFPVLPVSGRLHTRGFDRRATTFRWPIWNEALAVDAVRTALGLAEVIDEEVAPERLDQLAIRAVMQSERVTIGQGYGQLRPAVRVR